METAGYSILSKKYGEQRAWTLRMCFDWLLYSREQERLGNENIKTRPPKRFAGC